MFSNKINDLWAAAQFAGVSANTADTPADVSEGEALIGVIMIYIPD